MIRIAPFHLTVHGLLAGIVGTYLVMAMYYPLAYIWATYEDLIGEWLQFYLFVAAFIFSIRLAFSGSRYRIFFALLAVSCFYVFMEEISWGQRIIGFASPEFFQRHNLQRQVNLHNFLVGPFHTLTKVVIEYMLATALVVYGLVYPLAVRFGWALAGMVQRLRIPAPPLYLWPYFVIAALLEVGLFRFNEAEIAEVLIGLALSIMAVHYYVEQSPQSDGDHSGLSPSSISQRRTLMVLLVFGSTITLATGTTYGLYAVPHVAAKTDRRIMNGIEKFAGRYMRYEQYEMAAQLYQRLHAEQPRKTSILRKLARAYQEMGDEGRFREYIEKTLALDLDAYRRRPERVSVNLSLVRTYRETGQQGKAAAHLQQALHAARQRVRRKPTSASAAYWLGETYVLLEDYPSTLAQFERAFALKPTSKKYRKALLKARSR
jgi:tetratricopeptide (TPR) repeat protein